MTPPLPQPVSGGPSAAEADRSPKPAVGTGPFVINLCSSTTPMALSQPKSEALKRFSFFVSRRLEDGRERFRLHMGYFQTLQEADEWVAVVREIYPGAWAAEAPGRRLREREAALAATQAGSGAANVSHSAVPSPAGAMGSARTVPGVPAAAAVQQQQSVAAPPMPSPRPAVRRAVLPSTAPQVASAVRAPSADVASAPVRQVAAPQPRRAPPTPMGQGAATPERPAPAPAKASLPGSNVREVLKSLDDTGHTRQMPAAGAARAQPHAASTGQQSATLSDTQALRILENRWSDHHPGGGEVNDAGITMLRPDDPAMVRALKEAVQSNAPVSFAVQLQWSVQPIDLNRVPPLAIFSAYTLYTVEGSREGRRWFGLRLGFFSDAISAKQVAYYVRSEFSSVAVVPVSTQERTRASSTQNASDAARTPARAPKPKVKSSLDMATDEFKLIDADDVPAAAAPVAMKPQPKPQPKTAAPAARKGNGKAPGKIRARERRTPQSLEETLEILGADQLEIDHTGGDPLNDTGVRHLKVSVQKNSAFSRLLDKLAERTGRS